MLRGKKMAFNFRAAILITLGLLLMMMIILFYYPNDYLDAQKISISKGYNYY